MSIRPISPWSRPGRAARSSPGSAVTTFPSGVRVVPILPRPTRRIYALWRSDAARRPAIRAAVEALRAVSLSPAAEPAEPVEPVEERATG